MDDALGVGWKEFAGSPSIIEAREALSATARTGDLKILFARQAEVAPPSEPTLFVMPVSVHSLVDDRQVLGPIVGFVAVAMMHIL